MKRRSVIEAVDHLATPVTWVITNDPILPYRAHFGSKTWSIRINSFPDEHLYTLVIDGEAAESFDEWPKQWERTPASGQTLRLAELERNAIQKALATTAGDRTMAAHLLGINRTALSRKLKQYQLAS